MGSRQLRFVKARFPMQILPMPFVVGSPRSGTTLLRLMLDAQSTLAIPPETGFLAAAGEWNAEGDALREQMIHTLTSYPPDAPAWSDFHLSADEFRKRLFELPSFDVAEGVRLFYRMYAERFGKTRWGDKTPIYCRSLEQIERILPDAHFVHVVRDGRDAIASLRRQWFSPGDDVRLLARYWSDNVTQARDRGRRSRHYLEVRFESLIAEPEAALREICAFLELDFEAPMLRWFERAPSRLAEHLERRNLAGSIVVTHEQRLRQQAATTRPADRDRIGAWRRQLTRDELLAFEEVAGETLRAFGYDVEGLP
jgi:hypothetical protein